MADAVSTGEGMTNPRRLENIVFLHLKQKFRKVSYYRTKQGYEVDFVIQSKQNSALILFQVCYSLSKIEVKEREVRSLIATSRFLGSNENVIITLEGERSEISENNVIIKIIPVWEWILSDLNNY